MHRTRKNGQKIISYEIPNWRKHQPRTDIKSMRWIRLDASIFSDTKFAVLPHGAKLLWIFLLCEYARNSKQVAHISLQFVCNSLSFRSDFVLRSISKLVEFQMVVATIRDERVSYETERDETERDESSCAPPISAGFDKPDEPEKILLLQKKSNDAKFVSSTRKSPQPSKTKSEKPKIETGELWSSYSTAYRKRYGTDPVRNAKINGQLVQIVKRIGADESPMVAEYFVSLNDQWYTKQCHAVGILLSECEKLRTMWATNRRTTTVDAKTAHWQSQFERIERGEL